MFDICHLGGGSDPELSCWTTAQSKIASASSGRWWPTTSAKKELEESHWEIASTPTFTTTWNAEVAAAALFILIDQPRHAGFAQLAVLRVGIHW
jgi:hypothetical protein